MVSVLTALAIQGNETDIIHTPSQCELWLVRDGQHHALLLSAPLDKKEEFQQCVNEIKKRNVLEDYQ